MGILTLIVGINGSGRTKFAREKLVPQGNVLVSSQEIEAELTQNPAKRTQLEQAVKDEFKGNEYIISSLGKGLKVTPGGPETIQRALTNLGEQEAIKQVRDNLQSGKNVIWDDAHSTIAERQERMELAKSWGAEKFICYWMNLPYSRCAANLANVLVPIGKSPREMGVDMMSLTMQVMFQANALEPPQLEEGFDQLFEVTEETHGHITE